MATDPVAVDTQPETTNADAARFEAEASVGRGQGDVITGSALATALGWLDRRFGRPWSVQSLRTCFALALVYSWTAYFLSWGLGGSGMIGNVVLLADPPQPARLVGALSAITMPLAAIVLGRVLGRMERRTKLSLVRRLRRNPAQFRLRLRLPDFERRYRWVLGLVFGTALVAVLIWFRRGDIAAFVIIFSWLALGPVAGIAMARRFSSPTYQGLAALIAGFGSIAGAILLILAFAGAGVSAFAFAILGITNIAFAGALGVLLDLVMGGVFTLGLALAGAGVATVALALAGAGTGIATLTGIATMSRAGLAASLLLMGGAALATLAFSQATVLAAAIGGISALAVAAAVSHNRRGRHGAYAGAIGAITLLTVAAVLLRWGDSPLVVFAACFFFLLPLANGLIDWLAWATSLSLVRARHRSQRIGSSILIGGTISLATAGVLMASLAYLLGFGVESYHQLAFQEAGKATFDPALMIDLAIQTPWGEGLWLSVMLLTPLAPTVLLGSGLFADGMLVARGSRGTRHRLLFGIIGVALVILPLALLAWIASASDAIDPASRLGALAKLGIGAARASWDVGPPGG